MGAPIPSFFCYKTDELAMAFLIVEAEKIVFGVIDDNQRQEGIADVPHCR